MLILSCFFSGCGVQQTWKINFWTSAPVRQGKSAMPMCSMEQKRCISVASRSVTREKGRKRENGDDERSTKNIYPADAPACHQYFISSWCHLKKFTCTTNCAACQPEVNTAANDLIWSDDSSSRLAFSQNSAGENAKSVSEACVHAYTVHNVNRRAGRVERGVVPYGW